MRRPSGRSSRGFGVYAALFVLIGSIYILTSPGRIDIVDGQCRYEAARNFFIYGKPIFKDSFLIQIHPRPGRGGDYFPGIGLGGSLAALPLTALGLSADDTRADFSRFTFSLTGPLVGALTICLLFTAYRRLGLSVNSALKWSLAAALATMIWPGANTVFDQIEQAFLILAGLLLADAASRRGSSLLAAWAGAVGGMVALHHEVLILLVPPLALAVLDTADGKRFQERGNLRRVVAFLAGALVPIGLMVSCNYYRFEAVSLFPLTIDTLGEHPYPWGNPLTGAASLLFSPGKSILLFSPLTAAGAVGFYYWKNKRPNLKRAALDVVLIHFALISSASFFGGDWCWGPRYLVVSAPLLALGLPFLAAKIGRRPLMPLIVFGVAVQMLGLSLDHHRYFYERKLTAFFWRDSSYYFRHSQWTARFAELADIAVHGVPETATGYAPTVKPERVTYMTCGLPEVYAEDGLSRFLLFYLPRPWPLWMPAARRAGLSIPLEPLFWAGPLLAAAGLSGLMLRRLARRGEPTRPCPPVAVKSPALRGTNQK
ncbi:MAG: hypothetical protein AB1641_18205 [Thermodesulfobacteriota bacterium]